MASNLGLYSPEFEHDACGIGFVANIKGNKSHQNVSDALTVLENMDTVVPAAVKAIPVMAPDS